MVCRFERNNLLVRLVEVFLKFRSNAFTPLRRYRARVVMKLLQGFICEGLALVLDAEICRQNTPGVFGEVERCHCCGGLAEYVEVVDVDGEEQENRNGRTEACLKCYFAKQQSTRLVCRVAERVPASFAQYQGEHPPCKATVASSNNQETRISTSRQDHLSRSDPRVDMGDPRRDMGVPRIDMSDSNLCHRGSPIAFHQPPHPRESRASRASTKP